MSWQIYDLTGSALALGLSGVFSALPLIPVSLIGGALADAVERRRLMLITAALGMLTVLGLCALTLAGAIEVWHLYAAGFVMTVTGVLDRPSRQSLIPSLVPREHLLNAYTVMTTLGQAGGLVGPMLAGLALALGGPAAGYAVHSVSFLAVVGALVALRVPPVRGGVRKASLGSIAEGLRFVGSKQFILGLLGLDVAAMLFGYYQTLLPVVARDVLRVGELGFGVLSAAPAVGSLAGAMLMLTLGTVRKPGWLMLGAVVVYGSALIGLGLSSWFAVALLFAAILGFADAISMAVRQTALQMATPDELRGRVSSAMQISVQGGNSIGAMNLGFGASLLGAGPATALGGVLVILAALLLGWRIRPVRDYRG
jgi:MFS family permease